MQKIDAHQHFWFYHPDRDGWINDQMRRLRNNFLPSDINPLLIESQIEGCISIQADPSENETDFLIKLSGENTFIKGVVGWVDLLSDDIEERLAYYSQFKKLKGFRHLVQSETSDDFMLRDDFCRGISFLKTFGFTYDILVYPRQLPFAIEFVRRFPEQMFVLDHLGKPAVRTGNLTEWKKDIASLANSPNVYCKLSGLMTEADWDNPNRVYLQTCIDTVIEKFSCQRVMFGSDWPVCLVATSYSGWCDFLESATERLSDTDKAWLWGNTALKFYHV